MNNKSSYKRILGVIVSVIFVFSGVISALVMYYDPFFHYHAPNEGGKYIFDNEVYQNPGIARNFDYDSVIVGSSMTRPLSPSEFDEQYACKSVQLPFSGGSVKNASIYVGYFAQKLGDIDAVNKEYYLENAKKYLKNFK